MSSRERVDQVRISGPDITLGDLRWLAEQCRGMPDSAAVAVNGGRGRDRRDGEPVEIVVVGNRPPPPPPDSVGLHYPPGVRNG